MFLGLVNYRTTLKTHSSKAICSENQRFYSLEILITSSNSPNYYSMFHFLSSVLKHPWGEQHPIIPIFPLFRHPIIPTSHYSDIPLFRHPIIPTSHYSDIPLFRHPIIPTSHYSDIPLFRHPIIPTSHYSDIPLFRHSEPLFRHPNCIPTSHYVIRHPIIPTSPTNPTFSWNVIIPTFSSHAIVPPYIILMSSLTVLQLFE